LRRINAFCGTFARCRASLKAALEINLTGPFILFKFFQNQGRHMAGHSRSPFLTDADGAAVTLVNTAAASAIVLACDHASNRLPRRVGTLGVDAATLQSHAAWDPGADALARHMARSLDAVLVSAGFSRLVIDVNRPPGAPESIRERSEIFDIPGNRDLSEQERAARAEALYGPFHDAIDAALVARHGRDRAPVLVTVHSFTPVYLGKRREVELGVVFDDDARLGEIMLRLAPRYTALAARPNDPYGPQDGVTHTLRRNAMARGLANVMLEIRNDLIATAESQERIGGELSALVRASVDELQGLAATNEVQG